ncbi:formylglycine-generating enzyme family protein [Desulforhopalus vacuolatus]|uniref:formylglycine-generating enzyme family protein n=1 Tax=Desulforhopalus vacuolatus TaxID=40414 RepID=UPI001963BFF0|nr:formylglycine-generating enzyme family protein [Desulforhopalus vacuolatus]MBM9519978.1 formylglycine-generating enzyme family protein [Desulforhopalus vacuolatus]
MSEKDGKFLILKKNAGEIALGRTKNMLSAATSILANAPLKRKTEGIAPPRKKHEVEVARDVGPHRKEFRDPTTGMEFVLVKGGCYQMGDTFGEGYKDEKPVHEVCVDDFYMGKYEVTQGEWQKIMGSNPSEFKNGYCYPVENVSWNDITEKFLPKLNRSSGKCYRLPTEVEWEYAARAGGKKVRFGNGIGLRIDIDTDRANPREINFKGIAKYQQYYSQTGVYREKTTKVGSFAPNSLGLYDMSGNVWEWCSDWYAKNYYSSSPRNNPEGPDSGSNRVIRGGSWSNSPWQIRAAFRSCNLPDYSFFTLGFRLVLPVH